MHAKKAFGRSILALVTALFILSSLQAVCSAALIAKITVNAGDHARTDTPISAELTGIPCPHCCGKAVHLEEIRDGKRIPVPSQIECGIPAKVWFILDGQTKAGQTRTFELMEGQGPAPDAVKAIKDDKALLIKVGDKNVLQYNYAIVPAPQGKSKLYDRSGFIHPMWSPRGTVLTEIHPTDHTHHVGIWMPWTHTQFEGKQVDFWNLNLGEGTVRFVDFLSTTSGPVYGGFKALQQHVALKTAEGEQVILQEVWDVRVYNVGLKDGYWLWDFVSTQKCVAKTPLHQEQYRYGGFGFRATSKWDEDNSMYLTSEGKTRKNGHATRAKWCEMAGEIGGVWEGVTMMDHPDNFQFPEPMRIWPSGHVFFNFCPSQATAWDMPPGKDFVFRYRTYVHGGKVQVADAENRWADFGDAPRVSVEIPKAEMPGVIKLLGPDGDTSHWQQLSGSPVQWDVKDGVLTVKPGKGSIVTKRDFTDFRMHLEFNVPDMPPNVKGQGRGNSGVYIQRRYEVQILDSFGPDRRNNECGAVYQTKKPDVNACREPGQWQSYDIVFHAARFDGNRKVSNARITVVQNGMLVQDNFEIPHKTGAGRPEGPEPGPIMLQDHGNTVKFRNIWIEPLES